mgnify:CR=1 FL=1
MIRALKALRAGRVYMITPYPDDVNVEEVSFLTHRDIEVPGWDAFRCPLSEDIRRISSEQVAALALSHRDEIARCDTLFISCTNLLAMDQIVNNAAKWHYIFDGKARVPLVIRMIVGRGWGQGPQHSQSLQAMFASVPGLKVVMHFPPDAVASPA